MLRSLHFLTIGAALAVLPSHAWSQNADEIHGTWTVEMRGGDVFYQLAADSPEGTGTSRYGQSGRVDDFAGLPAGTKRFTVGSVKFELRREAGVFAFEGAFREGRGAGLFTFRPRPEFTNEMAALGYRDELSLWRRYQLAASDVGPKYIQALKAEGYSGLPLDTVRRARTHGVSIEYLREMKSLGYHEPEVEGMIRMHDHGVTPDYVRTLGKAGYTHLAAEQIVRVHDHGVSLAYIDEVRKAGYDKLPIEDLVRTRDHGVSAEYITGMRRAGYTNVPIEDLVRARDHGVTPEYIADLKEAGLKELSLPLAIRLSDHGITPGFINHAKARGYQNASPEELVRLKNRGFWE